MRRLASVPALLLAACAAPPPGVPEPDAAAWPGPPAPALTEAWSALLAFRPDRRYPDAAAEAAAGREIDRLQARLAADPAASGAAGAALYRTSTDPVARVMIGLYLYRLDRPRGEPFVLHALASLRDADPVFPTAYALAREWASTGQPRFRPGILSVFTARRGRILLPEGDGHVETPECMAYVILAGGPELVPDVRRLLGHADPYVRRNAAFALGQLFDDASGPALDRLLAEGGPAAGGAAFALGELGRRDAVPALAAALSDPLPENRFWAAYALYELRAVEALPRLREALARETDEDAREELGAAVKTLSGAPAPFSAGAALLPPAALADALREAERQKGYETGAARAIAASAGREHLDALGRIRAESTQIPSGRGVRAFRAWGAVMKEIRAR
jgi:hypothetical protein